MLGQAVRDVLSVVRVLMVKRLTSQPKSRGLPANPVRTVKKIQTPFNLWLNEVIMIDTYYD